MLPLQKVATQTVWQWSVWAGLVTIIWGAQHRSLIWRLSLVTPYWAASPVLANTSIQYSVYDVPTLAPPLLTTTSLTSTETIRLTSRQTPHCWLLMAVAELCPARNEGQLLLRRIAARAATVPHRPRPWWSGHGCGQDYRCLLSGLGASLTLHTDSSLTDLLPVVTHCLCPSSWSSLVLSFRKYVQAHACDLIWL